MSEEKLTRAAIVTGGSRGIGRAVCVALAKQGCNVVVNYCHGAEPAEQTAALCRAEGVQAVTVQADVSTAEGCKALFDAAAKAFGRVDVLVNNAGITRDNLILRLTEQDFDAVLDTNLKSAFLCCKEAARRMVRQRYGRIVNLSSVVALRGNAGQTNYAASKAGLIGLTKSLARELAARNVTVNAVAPGFIDTDMTAVLPETVRTGMTQGIPAGRAGQPEDVAQAVAFFAAEQSSYLGEIDRFCAHRGDGIFDLHLFTLIERVRGTVGDRLHIVVAAEAGRGVEFCIPKEAAVAAAPAGDVILIVQHNGVAHEHGIIEIAVDCVRAEVCVGHVRIFARVRRYDGLLADIRGSVAAFVGRRAAFGRRRTAFLRRRGRVLRRLARFGGSL